MDYHRRPCRRASCRLRAARRRCRWMTGVHRKPVLIARSEYRIPPYCNAELPGLCLIYVIVVLEEEH